MRSESESSPPWVYLDLNVLGDLVDGAVTLKGEVTWVYSNEHFSELSRGTSRCVELLEALRTLGARRLVPEMNDFKPTGRMCLLEHSDPVAAFDEFKESNDEIPVDNTIQHDLIAALFGATNHDVTESIPARLAAQLHSLLAQCGEEGEKLRPQAEAAIKALEGMIPEVIKNSAPLETQREHFGTSQGVGSSFENSENPIRELWELVKDKYNGLTLEQAFGLEVVEGGTWVPRPHFDAVVALHSILNHHGFLPDKHLAKGARMGNILSDGRHMAYGSYCACVLSADRRFVAKARAIYKFLGLSVNVTETDVES